MGVLKMEYLRIDKVQNQEDNDCKQHKDDNIASSALLEGASSPCANPGARLTVIIDLKVNAAMRSRFYCGRTIALIPLSSI